MTNLAPYITSFLQEHLPRDRNVSRHTIASYSFTFELLAEFAATRLGLWPSEMAIEQITVELVLDFLDSLEKERENTVRTRNLRLAAIKSFFRYLEFKAPACLHLAQQVHAIPIKRFDQALVDYLERDELQAVLDAPDPTTMNGIRDRAMLHLTYAAGLRVSELIGLKCKDLAPDLGWVHVMGKGRRDRKLPVRKETRSLLQDWLAIRPDRISDHLFLNARGRAMTRHGFAHRLAVSGQIRTFPQAVDFGVSPSASFTREFDREGRGFDGGSREGAGRHAGPEAGCRGVAGTSRRFRSPRGHQGGVLPSSWHQSGVVIVLARQVWDGGLCQDRGAGFGAWLGCRA